MSATKPVPVEIGRANQHDVQIRWNDGHESVYLARDLRLRCGCAGCVSEMTGEEMLDPATVPPDVHPRSISPVGHTPSRSTGATGTRPGSTPSNACEHWANRTRRPRVPDKLILNRD